MGCCSSKPIKIICDHMGQDQWNTYSKTRDARTQNVDICLDFCCNQKFIHECESCNRLEPIQNICQLVNKNINYLLSQLKYLDSLQTQRQKLDNTSDIYIRLNNEYHAVLSNINQCRRIKQLFKDVTFFNNIQINQRKILLNRQINVNQMLIDVNYLINQLQKITSNQSSNEIK